MLSFHARVVNFCEKKACLQLSIVWDWSTHRVLKVRLQGFQLNLQCPLVTAVGVQAMQGLKLGINRRSLLSKTRYNL